MSAPSSDDARREPDREILRYQAHRGLNACPGFLASVQVDTGSEAGRLFVGLRADALEIYTSSDFQYVYDLEGRAARFNTPQEYRFRGISHQGSVARKRPGAPNGGMERHRLTAVELDRSCQAAWTTAQAACDALESAKPLQWVHPHPDTVRTAILPALRRARAFTPERLAAEAKRFASIYQPVPILPPDHYASLVLQATAGCSFNTCTFCDLYRGVSFRVRTIEEFERHLLAAIAFHGENLRRCLQIFLGQANALAIPQTRLIALLRCLRRHVELPAPAEVPARPSWAHGHRLRFTGVGSFLDGFTGLNKSATDYAELHALGLSRAYLGVESGSAALLRWLQKPATPGEMLETLRRLKAGGVATDVILLVGVGGTRFAREHVRNSLAFLRQSPLQPGDRVFLSELIERPGAPYCDQMDSEQLPRMNQGEINRQNTELMDGIRQLGLQGVPYRLEPFIY